MKTKKEQKSKSSTYSSISGNALIYVLIAIVLFAALGFTLMREESSGSTQTLSDDKATIYATELIAYAAQVKSAIDQLLFTGTDIDDLDFMDPSDASFNTGTQSDIIKRVFHPEGGGIIKARLADDMIDQTTTDPVAGWYLDRFNNVEWTDSSNDDVILVAYQIKEELCEKINEQITGDATIPVLTGEANVVLIEDSLYTGSNVELTTDPSGSPICAECDQVPALCVQNNAQDEYAFYTVIADQ